MDAYQVYTLFLALKRHFTTTDYDAIKYHFKIRTSMDAFERRNDRFFFQKISKHPDPKGLFLAALTREDPKKAFAGSIAKDPKYEQYYREWVKFKEGIEYFFATQLFTLQADDVKVKSGNHPKIIDRYYDGTISLETLCILHRETKILDYWNRKIRDRLIWPDLAMKIEKYTPFVEYQKKPILDAIREKFDQKEKT